MTTSPDVPRKTTTWPLTRTGPAARAVVLGALLAGVCGGGGVPEAAAAFEFSKGEHVCLIGNALADRMQHDGWTETLLQSGTAGKDLAFRNLGFAGDRVAERPRNRGFPSPETYLRLCGADVIFVFFGYNESFDGEGGVKKFKDQLSSMIDRYREEAFNGESAPRFVLFAPIAHEDHKSPNLPDGTVNNARLTLYAEAVGAVAKDKGETFVDLFAASQELYAAAGEPLTLNGVHLSAEGNRRLAEVIARELLGAEVAADAGKEAVRAAVLDKNWHWHNRYRATDGNDVWGGRSGLKFAKGLTNFTTLQRELEMLDVMTANRDPAIWAAVRGSAYEVDDSNVPPPVEVPTSVNAAAGKKHGKEGSLTYLDPGREAISQMKVARGFEVNLFASEKQFPELVNPVQMAVDTRGRLWVAAWKTYPKWEPLKEMDDRLLILPDEDRDGVADRAITFAKVHNPTGFEFWNGGVIVISAPDIIFLRDNDGDDRADERVVLFQGIDSADTHHAANALTYGPDGGVYYQRGVFHVSNVETPWAPPHKSGTSGMYRFNPRTFTFGFHANNSPNPHGISFDRWGYHYATDGTGGRAYQVVPHNKGFKMQELLKKTVRPVAASGVVSSNHFPEENQGNFLICNTITFLGIKQYSLDRNPETGKVWGTEVDDLLVSEDGNFRPTDIEFGDDGALYVSDWSNVVIGHMQYNVRDPHRDHEHGRVYRISAKGRPLQAPVKVHGEPIAKLLDNLTHPVDGVRYRSRIELSKHDTNEVIVGVRKWMAQFDPKKKEDAHPLLEALWLHQQHNVRAPQLLADLLVSPEPHARVAAGTVQHHWHNVDWTRGGNRSLRDKGGEGKPKRQSDPERGEIYISTVVEEMRYDITEFTVKADQMIQLTLSNPDYMPHNLLIVAPGKIDEIANAAIAMGAEGFKRDFRPESKYILTGTRMLDKDEEQTITFKAPGKKGDFPFICTFPGHALRMRGVMKVR